jgi:hypothetical protein
MSKEANWLGGTWTAEAYERATLPLDVSLTIFAYFCYLFTVFSAARYLSHFITIPM